MTKPYRASIEAFMSHFRSEGEKIGAIQSELHRKVLLSLALDPRN